MGGAAGGYDERGLLFPFVVCVSNGGPFDDQAFAAGYECGQIASRLAAGRHVLLQEVVRTPNVPQLDLIAMHYGYTLASVVPWPEAPDEWSLVTFRRPT